ncbi:hypothetical protein, partial [Agathobaculum sp.]|uniref:hypothetical protein n=1 Tax=Agathobaculum sp. TaxID=2048138 RepID=UPI0027BAAE79
VAVIFADIRFVRERCRTGKHGERASERQHQCENLFLMAEGERNMRGNRLKKTKSREKENLFEKMFFRPRKDHIRLA